jgi:hypothetical protein
MLVSGLFHYAAILPYGSFERFSIATMKLTRSHLPIVLFLMVAVVVGCRTGTVPQPPPSSEQLPEIGDVETSHPSESAPEPVIAPVEIPAVLSSPPLRALPESVLGAPEKESVAPAIQYDTVLTKRSVQTAAHSGWQYRNNRRSQIVGFEFSNSGGNRILPHRRDISKNQLYTRDFQFRFDDRARQDVHLSITDWVASRDKQFRLSELMNSVMLFFPRNYLPAVVTVGDRNIVTLPTGEEVEFDAHTHEVRGGVFSEAPVDLNPDKSLRQFPAIRYTGSGIMVRANARGSDPRLGPVATVTTGSPTKNCVQDKACNQCEVPAKEIWAQTGAARFRFAHDEDFNDYLLSRCAFGLPLKSASVIGSR